MGEMWQWILQLLSQQGGGASMPTRQGAAMDGMHTKPMLAQQSIGGLGSGLPGLRDPNATPGGGTAYLGGSPTFNERTGSTQHAASPLGMMLRMMAK